MDEQQEKALQAYEAKRREVGKALVGKPGARAEIEYGEAYQRLVVLGLAAQIPNRYRPGVLHRV